MMMFIFWLFPLAYAGSSELTPWQEKAFRDLTFIYKTITDNHPGPVDKQNPAFKEALKGSYEWGQLMLQKVFNEADYRALLNYFVTQFQDSHVQLNFSSHPKETQWTGFLMERINKHYQVGFTLPKSKVKRGWQLESCDGIPTESLMNEEVFPLHSGIEEVEAYRYLLAPYLLQGEPNFLRVRHKGCVFKNGTKKVNVKLSYSTVPAETFEEHVRNLGVRHKKISYRRVASKVLWVTLPTFDLSAEQKKEYDTLIALLKSEKDYEAVVFDLRGNGGGSSYYGVQMLRAVAGGALIEDIESKMASTVEWRVSPGNAEHLRQIQKKYSTPAFKDAEVAAWAQKAAQSIEEGLKNQTNLVSVPEEKTFSKKELGPYAVLSTQFVFLTDAHCMSACLDFLDVGLKLPNAYLAGHETGVDSLYMEIRGEPLPSELGYFSFPIKVYRDRERANNQPYRPKFYWSGSMREEKPLEDWILHSVLYTLQTRAPKK